MMPSVWPEYDRWNEALAAHFFSRENALRLVYLDVEDQTLIEVGQAFGLGETEAVGDFQRAVLATLLLRQRRQPMLGLHLERYRRWLKSGKENAPPFVALLGFFVNVADRMHRSATYAPNAYYSPLLEALSLEDDKANKDWIYEEFQATRELWEALNTWLRHLEGARGLPTATVFDHRVNIGYPLSQALLKAHDRERLQDFFALYYSPHEDIPSEDLGEALNGWLPGSRLTALVKTRWAQSPQFREHVATIVRQELLEWEGDGVSEADGKAVSARLRLIAQLSEHPWPQLDLGLVVSGGAQLSPGLYHASDSGAGPRLEVVEVDAAPARSVNGLEQLSMPQALRSALSFLGSDGDRISRKPRRLVVLIEVPENARFEERERVELNQESILISTVAKASAVETQLQQIARPGFARRSSEDLSGLPDGWILFSGVQVMGLSTTTDQDLTPLIASTATQLSFGGGLSIPGRNVWHSQQPPEVRASSFETSAVRLSVKKASLSDQSQPPFVAEEFSGTKVLSLSAFRLDDGDYIAELASVPAKGKPKLIRQAVLSLRSASTQRSQALIGTEWVGRDLSSEFAAVSAQKLATPPIGPQSRGPVISGVTIQPASSAGSVKVPGVEALSRTPITREAPPPRQFHEPIVLTRDEQKHCFNTGVHSFVMEGRGQRTIPKDLPHYCRYCDLRRVLPGRLSFYGDLKDERVAKPAGPQAFRPARLVPVPDKPAKDIDLLFDALCYARGGTWQSFKGICDQVDDNPWFALEFARNLEAAGHVELVLNNVDLRPTSWAMTEAALVMVGPTEALLTGFRDREVISSLTRGVQRAGGKIGQSSTTDSPTTYRAQGLSESALIHVCGNLVQESKAPLKVVPSPLPYLIDFLPSIAQVAAALPSFMGVEPVDAEEYDPKSDQWRQTNQPAPGHGYRLSTRPRQHLFYLERGDWRVCDSRWVKYLAAAVAGHSLLVFDPSTKSAVCRLGAQPPPLYERVLVLSGGYGAHEWTDTFVRYMNVPLEITQRVWERLGPPGWTRRR